VSQNLTWPERPTCHDKDWQAQRFGQQTWRAAGERLHPENDHVPAFRSCSYCGSMHPEDMLNALRAGAKAGGSDWKYGWPHKFYIDGIPNSQAGNLVTRMSMSSRGEVPTDEENASLQDWAKRYNGVAEWSPPKDGRCRGVVRVPDGQTTHGKWYNQHLFDLDEASFNELAPLLEQHTGIKFTREVDADGKVNIAYQAPRHGYQR
jgi:hypothetical protein